MRRLLFVSLLVVAVLVAACGSAATPTQAPQPTQAVAAPTRSSTAPAPTAAPSGGTAPTAAPTQAPAPANTTAPAAGGLSGKLTLAGSTTVQPLAEQLSQALMSLNPGLTIEVQGGGTSVGITSAGEGTVDIGTASRLLTDAEYEKYPDLQAFTIAYDGIAVIVNPGFALPNGLTKEQVQGIFTGEITNFKDVGGPDATIVVVSREEGSGTRTAFEDLLLTYTDAAGKKQVKPITDKALLQQSNGQIRTTVATTPNSIGYLSFGFLDSSVQTVSVGGVEPTIANVKNGTYPVFRPLLLLTKGAPNELANAFIYYILSPLGQEIVVKDYISYK